MRSVPPYNWGGTLSKRGATWAIFMDDGSVAGAVQIRIQPKSALAAPMRPLGNLFLGPRVAVRVLLIVQGLQRGLERVALGLRQTHPEPGKSDCLAA